MRQPPHDDHEELETAILFYPCRVCGNWSDIEVVLAEEADANDPEVDEGATLSWGLGVCDTCDLGHDQLE